MQSGKAEPALTQASPEADSDVVLPTMKQFVRLQPIQTVALRRSANLKLGDAGHIPDLSV